MGTSRVVNMARDEADEAERDDVEGEPETEEVEPITEPEPEQEAQPFAHVGPNEIKKAERAIEAQRERLGKILGGEAVAHECILCAGMGYLPDVPPPSTRFEVVATDNGVGLAALEPEPEAEYPEAKDKQACDWCDGWGFVLTGAKNPNAKVGPCSKCSGNGWVTVPVEAGQVAALPQSPTPVPPPESLKVGTEMVDAWGREYGHPHWGVPPANIRG